MPPNGYLAHSLIAPPPPDKVFVMFCRLNQEKLNNCRGVRGKMTYSEFQNCLLLADRMITSCALKKMEYGRGYQIGIQFHWAENRPVRGIRMDKKKCKPIFSIVERMIDTSEPLRAEYFRGYHRGIEAQVSGVSGEKIEEHFLLLEYFIDGSGDSYIDSYARGYHDGFEGMTPEGPSISSTSSGSPKAGEEAKTIALSCSHREQERPWRRIITNNG